ncbi:MAG: family 20 glycosylhydrolase [Bacteroidaceae bacterium]|nr:family 20 glycosylhydrolase [Bacteroidaceae bacterium]
MKCKTLALLITAAFSAAPLLAQPLTAPDVRSLPQEVKDTVSALRLTGGLTMEGNSDFRQMRDVCGRLTDVDMTAANVTVIPDNAFFAASQLKRIALPRTLETIGRYAFFGCKSLGGELALPEGMKSVGEGAFQGCRAVKSLRLPATLTHIGPWAFSRMTGLADTLVIPDGVRTIGRGAFHLSYRIPALDLPASLDTIGAEAFQPGLSLRSIRVRATVPPVLSPTAFGDNVFRNARLEVPAGSEGAYRKAPVWCRFFGAEARTDVATCTELAIIPQPVKVEQPAGNPLVWARQPLYNEAGTLTNEYEQLRDVLSELTDYAPAKNGTNRYLPCLAIDETLGAEAYTLDISADGLRIAGGSPAGVFYGIMTLRQVLLAGAPEGGRCSVSAPVHIEDASRLAVRELMIDPARTFIPVASVKEIIDEMARWKFNTLQLHLCDDQAWRVEIAAYPELTRQSSVRTGIDDMHRESAGYYTQAELRELVAYAAKRHVTLVPEIEMPGHQTAAIHALPWLTCDSTQRLPLRATSGVSNELLCPGRESTYRFLGTVFAELAKIFPAPYVHLGGDEAGQPPLACWTNCPDCQRLAARLGAKGDGTDNWRLQEYLFGRIIDTLRTRHGNIPMFWYETDFKRIPEGCVTYAWRHGLTAAALDAAAANNARVMLCPGEHCYLDYPMARGDMPEKNWGMPVTSLEQVYHFDPAWGRGEAFERSTVLGCAGTLWSEYMPEPQRILYMALPRALALSEDAWSPRDARSYPDFLRRLSLLRSDLLRRGVPHSVCY